MLVSPSENKWQQLEQVRLRSLSAKRLACPGVQPKQVTCAPSGGVPPTLVSTLPSELKLTSMKGIALGVPTTNLRHKNLEQAHVAGPCGWMQAQGIADTAIFFTACFSDCFTCSTEGKQHILTHTHTRSAKVLQTLFCDRGLLTHLDVLPSQCW